MKQWAEFLEKGGDESKEKSKINENKQAVDFGAPNTQSSISSVKTDSETERTNENIGDGVTDDTGKETTSKDRDNSTSQNKVEDRGIEQSSKPSS